MLADKILDSEFAGIRVGIIGSGFMARGVASILDGSAFQLSGAVTRRPVDSVRDFPVADKLTNSLDEVIEKSDLIVEVSGDTLQATAAVARAFEAGLPVVTLNSEFHVTTGSWFVGKGLLTEAEGDQPGCLAALRRDVLEMGFEPLVYGNVKGFLNRNPRREDMDYWSAKQGISLGQTTSFTDGTKLQFEQALVANAFGADIYRQGLIGPKCATVEEGAQLLSDVAHDHGRPLSDYVVTSGCPGVFITGRHAEYQRPYLSYLKMGDGPYYTLLRNYHLCHLELLKTVKNLLRSGDILLDNSASPRVSVMAVAKRDLAAKSVIPKAIGSFDVRGEAVEIAEAPDHLPIGLMNGARLKRRISKGEPIRMADVELPESPALEVWNKLMARRATEAA